MFSIDRSLPASAKPYRFFGMLVLLGGSKVRRNSCFVYALAPESTTGAAKEPWNLGSGTLRLTKPREPGPQNHSDNIFQNFLMMLSEWRFCTVELGGDLRDHRRFCHTLKHFIHRLNEMFARNTDVNQTEKVPFSRGLIC